MRVPPRRTAAALLVLPFLGVACGGSGGSAATKTDAVKVVDNRFEPATVEVSVGDTVTWTFSGAAVHNVTGSGFRSKTLKTGAFTHTFSSAGKFSYICTIHAGMKGVVRVS